MLLPQQIFWPLFNISSFAYINNLMTIYTSISIANFCWQVITIEEEFLHCELLIEPVSLIWWRISLPNKLSGGIEILAPCAQMEHLWRLATHLVLLLWWRNTLLISTCSGDHEKTVSISMNIINLLKARADTLLFQEVLSRNESRRVNSGLQNKVN